MSQTRMTTTSLFLSFPSWKKLEKIQQKSSKKVIWRKGKEEELKLFLFNLYSLCFSQN